MKRAYREYLATDEWKKTAKSVREYYNYKCAVCDLDYREKGLSLHVHHLFHRRFGKSIIGREHPNHHLRLLCSAHHPKGKLTNESIQLWRKAYRFRKRWKVFFKALEKFWPTE
ncbi:MAG: hypothetical protein Q7R81_03490 [Candidatus Peregrinibacteria bacterium]|nr:hypothetical protein [Candidatus Peregrinibacteria bacterium]